jgi:hypothetical protein
VPFSEAELCFSPAFRECSDRVCRSLVAEAVAPIVSSFRHEFGLRSLADVALHRAARLREANVLEPDAKFIYEIWAEPQPESTSASHRPSSVRSAPLSVLSVPVAPLLQDARPVGELVPSLFPVFFTIPALARAERCARRGASANPPVESGAALVGPLCSCPDTGEFFCVVTEAFDLVGSEESPLSLGFSNQSWTHIQTVLRARQAAQPAVRLLGQAHGHPFVPNDGETCAECPKRAVCTLTSVFASASDRSWMRAVFSRQPWQLCLIFGLTARNEPAQGLFALHDGRLTERGFHVLPDFDPDRWETLSSARAVPSNPQP